MNKENKNQLFPALPFPPISWWLQALDAREICILEDEPYQKAGFFNRYYLAGKQGYELLSIPVQQGRNQKTALNKVAISNAENWQKDHWRGIQTLLGKSPFFEFIDYQLAPFFTEEHTSLFAWSLSSIQWANQFLGQPIDLKIISGNLEDHPIAARPPQLVFKEKRNLPAYYQVFKNESGFLSDCSIIDLICNEGKAAMLYLEAARSAIA